MQSMQCIMNNISRALAQVQQLHSVQLSYPVREGNKVAHMLVQRVRGIAYVVTWIEETLCMTGNVISLYTPNIQAFKTS